jgi:predicted HNH restriction endonuclease
MIQITPEELIEFVRAKQSLQLKTGKQGKVFTVRLNGNDLEIVPHATKKARAHEMKWLRRVCDRFSRIHSFRPTDYSELTVNASYTLAIIREYLSKTSSETNKELLSMHVYEHQLAVKIGKSSKDSPEVRRERLAKAPKTPGIKSAVTIIYMRNPDVIVEVLLKANGFCQECGEPAPFLRKSDGTPYLDVHHRRPLAKGGEDTVANAIALCPNCHRKAHHG